MMMSLCVVRQVIVLVAMLPSCKHALLTSVGVAVTCTSACHTHQRCRDAAPTAASDRAHACSQYLERNIELAGNAPAGPIGGPGAGPPVSAPAGMHMHGGGEAMSMPMDALAGGHGGGHASATPAAASHAMNSTEEPSDHMMPESAPHMMGMPGGAPMDAPAGSHGGGHAMSPPEDAPPAMNGTEAPDHMMPGNSPMHGGGGGMPMDMPMPPAGRRLQQVDPTAADFTMSNLLHNMNGYVYGAMPVRPQLKPSPVLHDCAGRASAVSLHVATALQLVCT